MGHKHSKKEILDGALATALESGLSRLSYGRVAKHLGISDRIIVYYFPTMHDLIGEVLVTVGTRLQETLGEALAVGAADHIDLLRSAWPTLTRPDADPIFSLFFEASGLAAAGSAPYDTLVPQLIEQWITWLADFIDGPLEHRQTEAETAVAVIDGILLLRQTAGTESADRAATRLGIREQPQPNS